MFFPHKGIEFFVAQFCVIKIGKKDLEINYWLLCELRKPVPMPGN